MISTRRTVALAVLAGAAYTQSPAGIVIDAGDLRAVLTELDGAVAVAIRGTVPTNWRNWLRDANAIPSIEHPTLGWCHSGFMHAADTLAPLLAPHLAGRRVIYTGHSLGGSVAVALAALRAAAGLPIEPGAVFEPARVGMEKLAAVFATSPAWVLTRFGDDPVPEVPWWPYRHAWPADAIGHAMADPIDCHSMTGVIAWLQAQQMEAAA